MTIRLVSNQSIKDLGLDKPKSTAMVYGFQHCEYEQVCQGLKKKIVRAYDWSLGNNSCKTINLSGERVYKIDPGALQAKNAKKMCNRYCKAGLVNLVIENYRKQKNGEPLTPVIFCIDIENNPYPLTSKNLLSKTKVVGNTVMNQVVTHSELRRAYKLCNDPRVREDIREIAKKTFKFVHVKPITSKQKTKTSLKERVTYNLTEIAAPWENSKKNSKQAKEFATELAKRKEYAKKNPVKRAKKTDWRAQLNDACHPLTLCEKITKGAKTVANTAAIATLTLGLIASGVVLLSTYAELG